MSALITNQLATLADEVNMLHAQAESHAVSAVELAARCGQKLIEAKAACAHGEWLPWLESNCPAIPQRRAQKYMALTKYAVTADLESDDTKKLISKIWGNAPSERKAIPRKQKPVKAECVISVSGSSELATALMAHLNAHNPSDEMESRIDELAVNRRNVPSKLPDDELYDYYAEAMRMFIAWEWWQEMLRVKVVMQELGHHSDIPNPDPNTEFSLLAHKWVRSPVDDSGTLPKMEDVIALGGWIATGGIKNINPIMSWDEDR